MKKILVLGAGFVAAPLVDYLARKNYSLTIASQFIEEAEVLSNRYKTAACALDVSDHNALAALISHHDLVVSFVPFVFHERVAEACIQESKHLVTASYETERMRSLDSAAKAADIIIVNEIGLDPGIDHLSAMQVFDEIKENEEQLESFVSWCGGLPAPSANDNPLGYKFSWSPKSVLLALLNDARYLQEGQIKRTPAKALLTDLSEVVISEQMILEGYPNRDSIGYIESYGLEGVDEVLRGTLRYRGFSAIMQAAKDLGLFARDPDLMQQWAGLPWRDYLVSQINSPLEEHLMGLAENIKHAFDWLGLTGTQKVAQEETILDAFCTLLTTQLSYAENQSDMVVMQHQFKSSNKRGQSYYRTSTLVLEGQAEGFSAMAKTVGTPAAITVDLILNEKITQRGVVLPLTKDFYQPILALLAEEGIRLEESLSLI